MRAMKECHCMLFLTNDNDFAGADQTITMAELEEGTAGVH
jgi:ferredoxin-thioredoxin reductase catalytic chain